MELVVSHGTSLFSFIIITINLAVEDYEHRTIDRIDLRGMALLKTLQRLTL